MSIDIAWFPDYGHLMASIFLPEERGATSGGNNRKWYKNAHLNSHLFKLQTTAKGLNKHHIILEQRDELIILQYSTPN